MPRTLKPGMKKMKAGRMLRSRLPVSMHPLSPRMHALHPPPRSTPLPVYICSAGPIHSGHHCPGQVHSASSGSPGHCIKRRRTGSRAGAVGSGGCLRPRGVLACLRPWAAPRGTSRRLRTLTKRLPSEMPAPVLGHHRRPLPASPRAPHPPGARDPAGYLDLYWDLV